jgi:uncharacterized protein YeeX (DUF496 family)
MDEKPNEIQESFVSEVNKKLNYNKEQLKSLENLKNYMKNPAGMKSGGLVDKSLKGGTKLI